MAAVRLLGRVLAAYPLMAERLSTSTSFSSIGACFLHSASKRAMTRSALPLLSSRRPTSFRTVTAFLRPSSLDPVRLSFVQVRMVLSTAFVVCSYRYVAGSSSDGHWKFAEGGRSLAQLVRRLGGGCEIRGVGSSAAQEREGRHSRTSSDEVLPSHTGEEFRNSLSGVFVLSLFYYWRLA